MSVTVTEAIYRAKTEGKEQVDALSRSVDGLSVSEEKLTRATTASEQGFDRLRAKLDPSVRAQQQYQATLEQVAKYEMAGIGSQQQRAQVIDLATERYNRQVVALGQEKVATDAATKATGLQRYELINLSRQFQDVGVSLVSGQSPFLVMVQQGTQIADVFSSSNATMRGFFEQVLAGARSILTPFNLVTAALVATAGAVYALKSAYRDYAKQVDEVARLTNSAAKDVAQLQSAAAFEGVSQNDFFSAMKSLSANVADARDGLGSLAPLLRANGQAAGTFEQSLNTIADLIKNARDDQQRLKLLQEAGLPATMEYVRLLRNGADGLAAARAEASSMGTDFDRNMIDKARDFDRAWNKSWENFKVYARGSIQEARDYLDKLDQNANEWIRGNLPGNLGQVTPESARASIAAGFGTRLTQGQANSFYDAIPGATKGSNTIDPNVLKQQLQLEQQRIQMLGEFATVADKVRLKEISIQQARLNGVSIDQKTEQALLGLAAAQEVANRAQAAVSALGSAATIAEQYDAKVKSLNATMASGALTQEQYNRALAGLKNDQYVQSLQDTISALGDAAPSALVYKERVAELQQQLDQGRISQETFNQAVALANPLLKTIDDQISQGLTGALTDIVSGTKSAGDAFTDFANTAIKAIEQMIIKLYIVEPLMNSLRSGGSSLGSVNTAGRSGLLGGFIIPGILHDGGLGRDAPSSGRMIHPAYFDDAPRFHAGKLPWGPDEMPAIIRPEEEVLTTSDPRHRWNIGAPGSGVAAAPAGGEITVRVTTDVDKDGNIKSFVQDVSGQVAGQVVKAAQPQIVQAAASKTMRDLPKARRANPNLYAPS